MKIKYFVFSLIVLIFANSSISYAKDYSCKEALENEVELTVTETFTAYLKALYDDGLLTQNDLIQFANTIENTQEIPHPFATVKHKSSDHDLHEPSLEDYIANQNLMDIDQILNWTKGFVGIVQRTIEQKVASSQGTESLIRKMQFHRIDKSDPLPKRSLREKISAAYEATMDALNIDTGNRVEPKKWQVRLGHSFEMMDTVVTQAMWAEVTGFPPPVPKRSNRTFEQVYGDRKIITINGKNFSIWPNDPVSEVSWWSAIEFANRLSIREGRTPVYDTSRVKFASSTSFEKGNLATWSNQAYYVVRINEKANGYRLPTQDEFDFAATNRGSMPSAASDKNQKISNEKMHVEFFNNSTMQYEPLIINGKKFYDLHNGQAEWICDFKNGSVVGRGLEIKINTRGGVLEGYYYRGAPDFQDGLPMVHASSFRLVRPVD